MIKPSKIYKMRVVLHVSKTGAVPNVFKAAREMILASGLPYEKAKANAQWPRFVYGPAVPANQTAEREYVDVYLSTLVPAEEVRVRLEAVCPEGFSVLEVHRVPYAMPSVQHLAAAAIYSVEGDFTSLALEQTVENYFNAPRVEVVYLGTNGITITKNVKPYILNAKMVSPQKIQLTLGCVGDKWIHPQEVLAGYLRLEVPIGDEAWTIDGFTFTREGLYWKDSQGALHLI